MLALPRTGQMIYHLISGFHVIYYVFLRKIRLQQPDLPSPAISNYLKFGR